MRVICKDCLFWDKEDGGYGLCRRYPPKLIKKSRPKDIFTNAEWPTSYHVDWCGEYVERPNE